MINLYRDPQCKSVVIKMQPEDIDGQNTEPTTDGFANGHDIKTMKKKIKELESFIQSQQSQLDLYTNGDRPS